MTSTKEADVLYISYDGLMEPLGQSQILQYVLRLAEQHRIVLITYEKSVDWADAAERKKLQDRMRIAAIEWIPLRYHKSPTVPATMFDLAVGVFVCLYVMWRYSPRIVHARSYVPSILSLALKSAFGVRYVFDMRGFWADEKVDAGQWRHGSLLYKAAKWFEKRFLLEADVVVSLSHAGINEIKAFPYLKDRVPRFEIIPTCANLEMFRPNNNAEEAVERETPFTVGYVGTVSGWYLFDPVLECFLWIKEMKPDANLLILNRGEHSYIQERLNRFDIGSDVVEIKSVPYGHVAREMARMDATVFFIKQAFSKRASSPTKLGEFLGCGIPCLSNDGIGDMTRILEEEGVGVILREFTPAAQREAVQKYLRLVSSHGVQQKCVAAAHRHFSLDVGVQAYHALYRSLS